MTAPAPIDECTETASGEWPRHSVSDDGQSVMTGAVRRENQRRGAPKPKTCLHEATKHLLACIILQSIVSVGASAQGPGTVIGHQQINDTEGNFGGGLSNFDKFGSAVTLVGDLDGSGTADIAVGAPQDDDGGSDRGAVWVLFLASDGTVLNEQKISSAQGGLVGPLSNGDTFGHSLGALAAR